MQNLPISAHLTVVSAAPSAPVEGAALAPGAASPEGGSDFSNLLAAQLAAKVDALARQPADVAQDAAPSAPAAVTAPDGSSGLSVIAFMPLAAPAQVALAEAAEGTAGTVADLTRAFGRLGENMSGARAAEPPASERPVTDPAANFAATVSELPARGAQRAAAEEAAAEVLDPTVKLSARPEAGMGETQPVQSGWQAPATVVAKAEIGAMPAAPATQSVPVSVEARVGSAGWGAELGQKVVWLANQQQQVAHINVTPPQLGPIEIRLNLAQDQASATFVSPHAAVREAIEAALPRLREMLAESGLTLGNVDVSAHSFGQARQHPSQQAHPSRSLAPELAASTSGVGAQLGALAGRSRGGEGLVDIFA